MQIDADQWALEYEQVAPLLQIRIAAEARDWRTHVDAAASQLRRAFPVDGRSSTPSSASSAPSVEWATTQKQLHLVGTEVAEQLAKISTREQFLNGEFASRTEEYRNKKANHETKQVRFCASVAWLHLRKCIITMRLAYEGWVVACNSLMKGVSACRSHVGLAARVRLVVKRSSAVDFWSEWW